MRPRIRHLLACLSLAVGLAAGPLFAEDPPADAAASAAAAGILKADGSLDLDKAVKYFEDLYRSDSSHSVAEMTVKRPRSERTLGMRVWTEGQDKSLVVITDPAREAGTATLKVDKNLWNYLPRIKRTIRIPPSMMLQSWMGSDLTNDDIVRESSYSEDYDYELVGKNEAGDGWVIRFVAKEGVVGLWKRFDLTVSTDGLVPMHSDWYNRKGELARVLDWQDVQEVDGKRIPMTLILRPMDKDDDGYETRVVYHSIEFNVTLPDGTFSLSRLERQR